MSLKRILIVDDQHEMRQVLRAALGTLPHRLELIDVPSGEEAMLVLSKDRFDLLVLDIRLAGISGLELLSAVMETDPGLKTILVTGLADLELRENISHAGADAYFFKPLEMSAFLDTVLRLLSDDDVVSQNILPNSFQETDHPDRHHGKRDDSTAGEKLSAEEDRNLDELLQDLAQKLSLQVLTCFHKKGAVLAQGGEWPTLDSVKKLVDYISHADRLAKNLVNFLDQKCQEKSGGWFASSRLVLWDMVTENIYLIGMTQREPATLAPHWWSEFHQASQYIAKRLAVFSHDDPPDQNTLHEGHNDSEDKQPEIEIALGDIEQFLSNGLNKDSPDVDLFWEEAANQAEYRSADQKGLTYDQARELGLAPED